MVEWLMLGSRKPAHPVPHGRILTMGRKSRPVRQGALTGACYSWGGLFTPETMRPRLARPLGPAFKDAGRGRHSWPHH